MDLRKKLNRAPEPPVVEVKLEQMGVPTVPLKRKKPIAAIQEPYANGVYREPPLGTIRKAISLEDDRKQNPDLYAPPRIQNNKVPRPRMKINYYWVAQLVLTALGVALLALIYIKK